MQTKMGMGPDLATIPSYLLQKRPTPSLHKIKDERLKLEHGGRSECIKVTCHKHTRG